MIISSKSPLPEIKNEKTIDSFVSKAMSPLNMYIKKSSKSYEIFIRIMVVKN